MKVRVCLDIPLMRICSIMAVWCQDHEVINHIASTVQRWGETYVLLLYSLSPLHLVQGSNPWNVLPTFRGSLSLLNKPSGSALTASSLGCFLSDSQSYCLWKLDKKFSMKINHYICICHGFTYSICVTAYCKLTIITYYLLFWVFMD